MGTKMVPLTLGVIDEGRFMAAVNEDLARAQERLVLYVAEHGVERAEGSKAELQIKITLRFDGPDEVDYSVKGITKLVEPGRPASVTRALGGEQDGRPCLEVRPSGSSRATPRQGVLCGQHGERVDPDTGEIIPDGKSKAAGI